MRMRGLRRISLALLGVWVIFIDLTAAIDIISASEPDLSGEWGFIALSLPVLLIVGRLLFSARTDQSGAP